MQELIQAFSFERVQKAGARFDPDKAKWFNEQQLRAQDDGVLGERFALALKEIIGADHPLANTAFATGAVKLLKDRVQFEHDFYETGKYLFEAPESYDEKVIAKRWNDKAKSFFLALPDQLSAVATFTAEETKSAFEQLATNQGLKPGDVLQLFRVIVSGQGSGIDLFGMVELLGKQEVNSRIQRALERL